MRGGKWWLLGGAVVGGAVLAWVLSRTSVAEKPPEPLPEATASARLAAKANNNFALVLYGQLSAREGNIVVSPYSIYTALAMTSEGAAGKTAEEMEKVLHLGETVRAAQRDLHARLQSKGEHGFTLSVANRIWADARAKLLPDVGPRLKERYLADAAAIDFASPAKASAAINAWAKEYTGGKIGDLTAEAEMTPMTRLAITNAIFFKGSWDVPFNKSDTQEERFTVSPEKRVRVMMMRQTKEKLHFADTAPWREEGAETKEAKTKPVFRLLALDYRGGDLQMVFLLPEPGEMKEFEAALNAEMLDEALMRASKKSLPVALPRFVMEGGISLEKELSAMGMAEAFDVNKADFTKFAPPEPGLYVSMVKHRAIIEVNEEGTEAAAATAMTAAAKSDMPRRPPEFIANRPFLFVLRDKGSGAILFIGRVADPTRNVAE